MDPTFTYSWPQSRTRFARCCAPWETRRARDSFTQDPAVSNKASLFNFGQCCKLILSSTQSQTHRLVARSLGLPFEVSLRLRQTKQAKTAQRSRNQFVLVMFDFRIRDSLSVGPEARTVIPKTIPQIDHAKKLQTISEPCPMLR